MASRRRSELEQAREYDQRLNTPNSTGGRKRGRERQWRGPSMTRIWMSTFARMGRTSARQIIREPWKMPMAAQNLAVRIIQSAYRGYLARKFVILKGWEGPRITKPQLKKKDNGTPIPLKEQYRELMPHYAADGGYEAFAAAKIQATYWMWIYRRHFVWQRFTMYHIAAMEIQYVYRASKRFEAEKEKMKYQHKEIDAAIQLQNAWRAYANKRIFRYYRDLIKFRNSGDPRQMLKTINASEANLIDPATKLYVRYRLGGYTYPPTIYYKVFTSTAVCDIGSFAPRDYANSKPNADAGVLFNQSAAQSLGQAAPDSSTIRVGNTFYRAVLTNQSRVEMETGADIDWYARWENNGWRSVTAKSLEGQKADPVTRATAAKRVHYNHNKLRRKEDMVRLRKQRKRKWMQRLYLEGLANGKEEDEYEPHGPETFSKVEVDFDDPQWEQEAEAMLNWSEDLDFDSYLSSWHSIGTSATSDYLTKLNAAETLQEFEGGDDMGDELMATM